MKGDTAQDFKGIEAPLLNIKDPMEISKRRVQIESRLRLVLEEYILDNASLLEDIFFDDNTFFLHKEAVLSTF